MKRYALPISILVVIIILIGLTFLGGSSAPDYTSGIATEPELSQEWVRGNPNAAVKLIEYSDFQCPACRSYYGLVKQLETEYGDRVAFVYRHYPLYQIHANADYAARVSEAAGVQGKFWEMHDQLFESQGDWDKLLDPGKTFAKYATELGLDADKLMSDSESTEVRQEVANDYQRGQRIGVAGTPTFIVGGAKISNPGSLEEFQAVLNLVLGTK